VHHDEKGAGGIAQVQQGLAQGRHGAGIIFVLIVRGVERVENQDLGGCSQCTAHEREAAYRLRDGKLKLAPTARRRDAKAEAVRAGRQGQGEVGDQQRHGLFIDQLGCDSRLSGCLDR
jgi:hypothetical protein